MIPPYRCMIRPRSYRWRVRPYPEVEVLQYRRIMPYAVVRRLKFLVVGLQVILVGCTALAFSGKDFDLLQGYLLVSGWQYISMLVHAFGRGVLPHSGFRRWYPRVVVLLLLLALPRLLFGPGTLFLIFVLLAAPSMAVAYLVPCVVELERMRRLGLHHATPM